MSIYKGIVQKGDGRGRKLGFPTANILLPYSEVSGIYAARVRIGEETFQSAAFADGQRQVLEAYVLDFDGDLYGKEISIELLQKIRGSEKFENDDSLIAAIKRDVDAVRAYFEKV